MDIGTKGKHLYRAQQTDDVKALLKKKNTDLVNVLPGCTSHVQPHDVSIARDNKALIKP